MIQRAEKKEPKPKLLSPDIFRWGRRLPHEGVGAKKFDMSLETREIKLFWRDIPGFCRDIPEAPEKFEKKKFVFKVWPLFRGPRIRNVLVTPTPKYFSKSFAVQMGGVLPYKWEAYCRTNGRHIAGFPFLRSLKARKVWRYKWGAYCRTNWRCTAVLFRQVVGVGVSETLPRSQNGSVVVGSAFGAPGLLPQISIVGHSPQV